MRGVDHRGREREREQGLDERPKHWVQLAGTTQRLVERWYLSENRLEKALRLWNQLTRRLVRAERLDVPRCFDERVVSDARHGCVSLTMHSHLEGADIFSAVAHV
jgi:hypothetical protein